MHRTWKCRTVMLPFAALVAGSCGSETGDNEDPQGSGGASGESSSEGDGSDGGDGDSGGDGDGGGSGTSGGEDPGDSEGATDDPGGTGGSVFIVEPDTPGTGVECDLWNQDCPAGEKCMPWANDGGNSWNAAKCSPVGANPDQPGDECTVEGSPLSGIDSCDLSSMCWDVSADTALGTCAAFCQGSADAPTCADPDSTCVIANNGTIILCLPVCDPLLQDCLEGQGCFPTNETFTCIPSSSGSAGIYGDPCEFANRCQPGLYCASAASVPGCTANGCCSEFCDLTDPNGVAACGGSAEGQECVPAYADGTAPPGFEHVGFCAVPT